MTALLWIIGIALVFRMVFSIWGRHISNFLMRRLVKMVEDDARRKHESYERHYSQSPFHDQIRVDDEVQVTAPKGRHKAKPKIDEVVEDIDFEEIKKK